MTTLLKTAAIAAIITGFANNANAIDRFTPLTAPHSEIMLFETLEATPRAAHTKGFTMPGTAKIGIARLDLGRLIPADYAELQAWETVNSDIPASLTPLSASVYLNAVPVIDFTAQDTDNKIDEIRIAAADSGMNYVLLYAVGDDANWASIGRRHFSETGLTVKPGCPGWQRGAAKALLIDTYSGHVITAATADDTMALTEKMGGLIARLSA